MAGDQPGWQGGLRAAHEEADWGENIRLWAGEEVERGWTRGGIR